MPLQNIHMGRRKVMDFVKLFPDTAIFLLLFSIKFIDLCGSATVILSTITPNQSLSDGDVLISAGKTFALGFFRPGNSGSRYLGVWYNKVSEQTVVWVANRNTPLNDTSGVVSLNPDGNLILTGRSTKGRPLWSTNATAVIRHVTNVSFAAKLLDTGNLVIIQEKSERILWQSFDYPTDTMMPFMKLGLDRRTGLNRALTSWRSKDDPGTGSCSYAIDPSGAPQLFLYKGSNPRWRPGPWNGQRWSGVPEMTKNFIFNVTYIDNQDEISMMYGIVNASIFSRMVLDESGSIHGFTWHEAGRRWIEFWAAPAKDLCDKYGYCGSYGFCDMNRDMGDFACKCLPGFKPRSARDWFLRDGSGGCVRARGRNSACGNGDGFVRLEHAKVPDARVARVNMSLSGEACEKECLMNCTCVAYTSADVSQGVGGSGCLMWFGDLVDMEVYSSEGQDLYIRVDAIELANARKRSKGLQGAKRTMVIAIVVVILAAVILIFVRYCLYGWFWMLIRDRANWKMHRKLLLLDLASSTPKSNVEENECEEGHKKINLPFFNMKEMKSTTTNFSYKLGQGGFGTVYKGQLFNGQEIAVKRLSKHSGQGAEEFKNEVSLIARLQHRNLVKLLGCCIDEGETMLIYEYMPNKSLDLFIFDDSRKVLLDWKKRYEIIIGIARGILYLHQDSRLRIIHRDLKTSNILLDANMIPKISDFGMARIFGGNQSQAKTNRVAGTYGYMSPEYALDGTFSEKTDVFSFGVVLLEIITGKRNHSSYNDNPLLNLIRYIWDLWVEGRALEIVDALLRDSWREDKVLRCIHIGLLCVQENVADRPTMSTIIFMLSNEVSLPSPTQAAFAIKRNTTAYALGSSTSGSTSHSNNEVTMSMLDPR